MDEFNDIKRSFWADAARGGGVIGLVMVLTLYVNVLSGSSTVSTVADILRVVALVALLYIFSKKRSMRHLKYGFSIGQAMGYVFGMMLFAGFIYGAGHWLLVNYVAPEYLDEIVKYSINNMNTINPEVEMQMISLLQNVIFWVVVGIIVMMIYGGLLGFMTSVFVKRKPEPIDDEE